MRTNLSLQEPLRENVTSDNQDPSVNYIWITNLKSLKSLNKCSLNKTTKSSPVTGLDWPRGFQRVKVPRFHDNGTGWW